MLTSLKLKLLEVAIPMIVAPITFILVQNLKHISKWINSAPAWVKQMAAAVIATALTLAGDVAGQQFCDPSLETCTIEGANWQAVVAWALAMILHAARKTRDNPADNK